MEYLSFSEYTKHCMFIVSFIFKISPHFKKAYGTNTDVEESEQFVVGLSIYIGLRNCMHFLNFYHDYD